MAKTSVFTVAVERPLHVALPALRTAKAAALRLDAAFAAAGVPDGQRLLLADQTATRAALESRLKTFRKRLGAGDRAVVVWIGPGGMNNGHGYCDCWDTLPDDRTGTSFSLRDFLSILNVSKAAETILLIAVPGIDSRDLAERVGTAPGFVALQADCSATPEPDEAVAIWCDVVAGAIEGNARAARDAAQRITARSIQKYLRSELPRRLRTQFGEGSLLIPQLFGSAEGILRETVADASGAVLDDSRLRRIVYRVESSTPLRELSDYRKTHTVPEKAGPASRRFVQRLATRDVADDLERIAAQCRVWFNLKRKDMMLVAGSDGTGSLRTPEFEYTVSVELDPDDSTKVIWRRELGRFADATLARSHRWESELDIPFDQLVFELSRPLDVESFIERLDDAPVAGVKVEASPDDRSCRLTMRGFTGSIDIRRNEIVVRGRSNRSAGLLDLLVEFLGRVGVPESPAVPLLNPGPAR